MSNIKLNKVKNIVENYFLLDFKMIQLKCERKRDLMNYENKIMSLFENGYLTTKKVVENNIPKVYLTKLVKANIISRVTRGLYTNNEALETDYMILQNKSKHVVFSNLTALYLHGYSERIPNVYNISVPQGYKGVLQNMNNVKLFYINKSDFNLGVITLKDENKNNIKVYDLERTICDIIKNKDKLDAELVNKAIRKYFYSKEKDSIKLYDYAKQMNILEKVKAMIEVLK